MAVKGLAELGARTVVVTDRPAEFQGISVLEVPTLGEEWSPFVTCLPLQWLCWAIANAKGFGRRHSPEVYERAQRFFRS
jgi:glucosamine 6-phosphate synthetase-like amidotransferase/phosphosugar isomerase protein